MARTALEFRSGTYFVNVDRPNGGTAHEALTWITPELARWWLDKFAPWVWANGGMLVDAPEGSS